MKNRELTLRIPDGCEIENVKTDGNFVVVVYTESESETSNPEEDDKGIQGV
ncbi:MAG: hypothetical protein LBQ73_06765 [Tannerellaceae bacterium]|jgi:nitrate reductase NapAB chaperone NapD|nr:hypothetical protein [Tannerellaceae bacterium]